MTRLDANWRSIAGRKGAEVQHNRHDPKATTAAGRAAFLRRFDGEPDPEAARKAYFTELGRRGGKVSKRRGKIAE